MITSLSQLRALLDTHTAAIPETGQTRLTLPASELDNDSHLAKAFSAYLDSAGLVVDLTNPIHQDDSLITVTGVGIGAPFTGMEVSASFSIAQNEAALTLVATSQNPRTQQDEWHFAKSFPTLAGLTADRLHFTNVSLTFGAGGGVESAFSFTGDLHLDGSLAAATWLLGGSTTLRLSGPITLVNRISSPNGLHDKLPVMRLTAPIGEAIQFGYFASVKLTLALECRASRVKPTSPLLLRSTLALTTNLNLAIGERTVPLPIRCETSERGGLLFFTADTSALSQVALNDLMRLANNTPLIDVLPNPDWLRPGDIVQLTQVGFIINPKAAGGLITTSFTISLVKDWDIVAPNIISVKQPLSLTFTVLDPLGAKRVLLALDGQVGLGPEATLNVQASYPNFTVHGLLEPESSVSLSSVAQHFLGSGLNLPAFNLTELELYAQPGSGTYEFSAGITSDLNLNIGITTLTLRYLSFAVQRMLDEQRVVKNTAAIRAITTLGPATLDVDWVIPGRFALTGRIPQIKLDELARTLTGGYMSLPSGFPELALEDSQLAITLESGSVGDAGASYTLAVATTLAKLGEKPGLPRIGFGFELRKDDEGFGFVVGLAVPEGWSLADIFPDYADLLGYLRFRNSALILSSLDAPVALPSNLTVPGLPAAVTQGLTFVTTIELAGEALGLMKQFFEGVGGLTMLAVVNPLDLKATQFKATLGSQPAGKGIIVWHGFELTFMARSQTIALSTSLSLTLAATAGPPDVLRFTGAATVPLNPTEAGIAFLLAMTGNWHNPFGIPHLDILGVGINVVVNASGFNIGLAGRIQIGDPAANEQVIFLVGGQIINGQAPGALLASVVSSPGQDKGVTMPQLIRGFTDLDLASVPLLSDIALKELTCYIVNNPTGFPDPLDPSHIYPAGFTVRSDMLFYGLRAKMDIEVLANKGIKAEGSLSEVIRWADTLVIADATGTKGASALIDTTALTAASNDRGDYLYISAMVSLFNLQRTKVLAYVRNGAFAFDLDYNVTGLGRFSLNCSLKGLQSFAAGGAVNFSWGERDIKLKWTTQSFGTLDLGTIHLSAGSVAARLQLNLTPTLFDLAVDVNFTYRGIELKYAYVVKQSFQDLASLIARSASELAAQGWEVFKRAFSTAAELFAAIGSELKELGSGFGTLLYRYYNLPLSDALTLFKNVSYSLPSFIAILASGYGIEARYLCFIMLREKYTSAQIADVLANGLMQSAAQAARIFYDLGFGAALMVQLLTNYYHQNVADAWAIVNDILNRGKSICAATAFAAEINAPSNDLDDLRRVRADLEAAPSGSKAQWYLELYNEFSPLVHYLITNDEDVAAHIRESGGQEIWDAILAAFRSVEAGTPLPMPSGEMMDHAFDILATMMLKSPELSNAVEDLWPDIQGYEGLTYPEVLQAAQAPHPPK